MKQDPQHEPALPPARKTLRELWEALKNCTSADETHDLLVNYYDDFEASIARIDSLEDLLATARSAIETPGDLTDAERCHVIDDINDELEEYDEEKSRVMNLDAWIDSQEQEKK